MAIITEIKDYNAPYEVMLNLYPDQFLDEGMGSSPSGAPVDKNGNVLPMPRQHVSKNTKKSAGWWKVNMDYFYTVALAQYNNRRHRIVRNYELLKGKLRPEDFYAEQPVMSFVDQMMADVDLPSYVQHYPIINNPINAMVGEKSKRPDVSRPKAMDAESQGEEMQYYTDIYWQYVSQQALNQVMNNLKKQGADLGSDEGKQQVEQLTQEKMKDYMNNYSSAAEVWAANMIEALKVEFNTKEMFEKGFRDLNIVNMEFFHNYEDKSRTGFKAEKENPKNVWWLTTPDKAYSKDWYAGGIIKIMELSEIIEKFDLTMDEIEHLRTFAMMAFFPYSRTSNLYRDTAGIDSIQYNTYDQAILRERNILEAQTGADINSQDVNGFLGNAAPNVGTFGNRFIVTIAYWISKRKVGLLTYINKEGEVVTQLVDDNYKDGMHPQEISIEWKWENQWYKGAKIGDDIYYVEPLEILYYCPIVGVVHEIENTESVSQVDLMKPLQTVANVAMNQLYRLLEKEKGKGFLMDKRQIPLLKGGSYEDSIEIWERTFEETGVVWLDNSPENTKRPANFNQFQVIDMTLTDQIRSRMELFTWCKNECWELVGVNRERLGNIQASQTATATNAATAASYAQTEPLFVQQEYIENMELQCILDIAQYLECKKPESTLSFIDSDGGNVFCKLQTATQLKNRDIKLFMTSRAEDQRFYNKMEELAQAALQNGVSMYEVAQFYEHTSVRKKMDMLRKLKDKQEQFQQQQQQIEQQKIQQQEQKDQAELQQEEQHHQDEMQIKVYEIDTKNNTEITKKLIDERIQIAKANASTEAPDMLDILAQQQSERDSIYKRDIEQMQLQMQQRKMQMDQANQQSEGNRKDKKLELEKERNEIAREQVKIQRKKANSPAGK